MSDGKILLITLYGQKYTVKQHMYLFFKVPLFSWNSVSDSNSHHSAMRPYQTGPMEST